MLPTKVFVSEFCLGSHLGDILSDREHPRQEGSPDVIQLASPAASAVPRSLSDSHGCPSLPFRDAHLISELVLDCEQWSFCLRLVDIRLKLFQGNSWNVTREKQNEKSENKANFFSPKTMSLFLQVGITLLTERVSKCPQDLGFLFTKNNVKSINVLFFFKLSFIITHLYNSSIHSNK